MFHITKRMKYKVPGIHISDKEYPFTEMILNGEKTIETRSQSVLDCFNGKYVYLIRTGKGPATVVGIAKIGGPECGLLSFSKIKWYSKEAYDRAFWQHRVPKESKFYWNGKPKVGYPLSDVRRIPETVIGKAGFTGDMTARDLDGIMPEPERLIRFFE